MPHKHSDPVKLCCSCIIHRLRINERAVCTCKPDDASVKKVCMWGRTTQTAVLISFFAESVFQTASIRRAASTPRSSELHANNVRVRESTLF